MKVLKRDGRKKEFSEKVVQLAIEGAMNETEKGIDSKVSEEISKAVKEKVKLKYDDIVRVENVQDIVETTLIEFGLVDTFRKYSKYREKRKEKRTKLHKEPRLLTDSFISKYKHIQPPMTDLGHFVYTRTYSRFLESEGRREYWWETVRRAVEYNCSLVPTSKNEAEKLFDNIFNLRQFLSGRTFWVGNSGKSEGKKSVGDLYPMGNFNCSFTVIDKLSDYSEIFYLLMVGSGAGIRILKRDVAKLPKIRKDIKMIHNYVPKAKEDREDATSLIIEKNTATLKVGDSKEGWRQALDYYFNIISQKQYKLIDTIVVDYSNVRPKGEKLKTFGGTASGHESLLRMFRKMDKIIQSAKSVNNRVTLRPIDALDFANIIAENVVSGGVRRSSIIALIDPDDEECIDAKKDLYTQVDGNYVLNDELSHRQNSNNSIFYENAPTMEKLSWQIDKMRYSGEPGWINAEEAKRRYANFKGVNPCGEILLDTKGMCNLVTLVVTAFIREDDTLDLEGLLEAQRLNGRSSYRMTEVEMELHNWDLVLQEQKVVGCSLTGWQDAMNRLGYSREEEIELLQKLRESARKGAYELADELGKQKPDLVTTVKPEGTLSQLPTVSSGVHYSHSPFYVRRVRISADDALCKAVEELGWNVFPEVGQEWETAITKVVEFPVKAPKGKTKYDVSAIEQLENYKMFMEHYVDHNASITIHVRDNEWEDVKKWVYDNWDIQVGLSFLSLDDSFYELLPYESIDEDEYTERLNAMANFRNSLVSKYETKEIFESKLSEDVTDPECASGLCPIR